MLESLQRLAIALVVLTCDLPAFGAIQLNSGRLEAPQLQAQQEQFSTSDVRFQSRGKDYTTYFTRSGLILAGFNASAEGAEYFEVGMKLVGSQEDVEITTLNPMLASNDQWLTDLPDYARIKYAGVYRGIDMVCYGIKDEVGLQFLISPGANVKQIRLRLTGTSWMEGTPDGGLVFQSGEKTIRMPSPVAYQTVDEKGTQQVVDIRYVLNSRKEITLRVGDYDPKRALIVNP